jgi:small subunit ribosomal protein S18
MARPRERDKRSPKDAARRGGKKKVCIFCKEKTDWVDYKDVNVLRRFMSDRGKIRARRVSGNCSQHQRDVAVAIKTARELALLPYTQRTVSERGPGRGRGGDRDRGRDSRPRDVDADDNTDVVDEVEELDDDLDTDAGTDTGTDADSGDAQDGGDGGEGSEEAGA